MPRNDSADSASITNAKSTVAMVIRVDASSGTMWRHTMRTGPAPMTRAAETNMRSRSSSTSARVVRR